MNRDTNIFEAKIEISLNERNSNFLQEMMGDEVQKTYYTFCKHDNSTNRNLYKSRKVVLTKTEENRTTHLYKGTCKLCGQQFSVSEVLKDE